MNTTERKKLKQESEEKGLHHLTRLIIFRHGETIEGDERLLRASAVQEADAIGKRIAEVTSGVLVIMTSSIPRALLTAHAIKTGLPEGCELIKSDSLRAYSDTIAGDLERFKKEVITLSEKQKIETLICVTHEPFFELWVVENISRALFGSEIHVSERGAAYTPPKGSFRVLERNGSYHCTL